MTRNKPRGFIALAGISALASASYATQPPCTTSDTSANTACGTFSLFNNTGQDNTAMGDGALEHNLSTSYNTAAGAFALAYNYGLNNTAIGYHALQGVAVASTSTGSFNTAVGSGALQSFSTSNNNSAGGYYALQSDTTGSYNTAFGASALRNNQTVNGNSAFGYYALKSNTIGAYNVALGSGALQGNTRGNQNAASGNSALLNNLTGSNNTGLGYQALYDNSSGSDNIAIGYKAGFNVKNGNFNIEIGNTGGASDGKLIRIGTEGTQMKTFIAGIYNVPLSGNTVVVTSTGQLGVAAVSSERFKTGIAPIGSMTAKLQDLRPVTFKLKSDATGTVQYGLVAEEVAMVYPELVIRDEHGTIDGVRYDELAPMLLNEVQQQATEIRDLKQQVARVNDLEQRLNAVLQQLKALDQRVAQR
jgi:hypothetical protein